MAQRAGGTDEHGDRDTPGAPASSTPGTTATGRPAAPGTGQTATGGATDVNPATAGSPANAARSRLGWVALTVTAVLLVWQVVYALTVASPGLDGREAYTSAWLLVSLVLAVGAAVLGIVAASQRVSPRWPATTALAVGTYVFLVCIATWAGSILTGS